MAWGEQRQCDELGTVFINAIAAPLGSDERTFAINLDTLAPTLHDACEQVQSAKGCTPWASYMAGQLFDTAKPIFTRYTPVTVDAARFVRLGAMALAAEPNGVARNELYAIAAGITLLQQRATDKPAESIILARE